MRVLFLTKYPRRGPSSRYRVLQYIPYLEGAGLDCEVQALHTEEYIDHIYYGGRLSTLYVFRRLMKRILAVFSSPRFSVVFIQKELIPYAPPFLELLLRLGGTRVIYDIDDSVFLTYGSSRNPVVRFLLGSKIQLAMRWSSAVLAGNTFLRHFALRCNRSTLLFPTVLDPEGYLPGGSGGGIPVVGWIGTPETLPYLLAVAEPLRRAREAAPFRLRVIGAPGLSIAGLDVEAVPWSESTEAGELALCDIGIMPLPAGPWAEGKCGLKLLQYMSASLAVVSSPGGGVEDMIRHGSNGFIARTEEEWRSCLVSLIDDAELRGRMGREGRLVVEKGFNISVWAPRLVEVIGNVSRGGLPEGIPW